MSVPSQSGLPVSVSPAHFVFWGSVEKQLAFMSSAFSATESPSESQTAALTLHTSSGLSAGAPAGLDHCPQPISVVGLVVRRVRRKSVVGATDDG